jgi:hypothetical protein
MAQTAEEKEVTQKALRLAEHLMQAHKRKIVDPLIASTALLVARRFRAQRRALDQALYDIQPLLMAEHRMAQALPFAASSAIVGAFNEFSFPLFDDRLDIATRDAYDGGWDTAAAQIGFDNPPPDRQFNDLISSEIDGTTKDGIMAAARDVFQGGLSFAALVTAVDAVFQDAVDNRAPMIATTEIASAFNAGASAVATAATQNGMQIEKAWNAEDEACDICQPNADQGWIDEADSFDSGDDEPPAHPNCRCSLELRTAED